MRQVGGPQRILLTGAAGQLGSRMNEELVTAGHQVAAFTRAELDIADAPTVSSILARVRPTVIVNCAAYNDVDAAESDPGKAYRINCDGPASLTQAALACGAVLVHFSTDFVFDGEACEPYTEGDPTNPLNVYGASKLGGEEAVRQVPEHYVVRLESLFGGFAARRSTVDRLLDAMAAGESVRAFVDRSVSPSYVPDVTAATRLLIERRLPHGTYHCVGSGQTTWFELASTAAAWLGTGSVVPVFSADARPIAPRPRFCALSNAKLQSVGVSMPTWQSALRRHHDARQRVSAMVDASQPGLVSSRHRRTSAPAAR